MMHPPQERREKPQANKPKSDKETAVTKEKEHTYDIDRLNIGDPAVELENDSKWILAQLREVHTSNIYIEITVLNVNVMSYLIFKPYKMRKK